jgi:hypothetical protein
MVASESPVFDGKAISVVESDKEISHKVTHKRRFIAELFEICSEFGNKPEFRDRTGFWLELCSVPPIIRKSFRAFVSRIEFGNSGDNRG